MSGGAAALRAWFDPLLAAYQRHEAIGLFLFLLVEEMGAPLLFPGDTLIAAAGARAGRPPLEAALVVGAAAAAAMLGSSLLYAAVRRGGRPLLARYGRFLHLHPERAATAERWFRRHGALAIVVGRLVPGLRTPTTVMAGLFGVPYRTFAPATACAAVAWAFLYYAAGVALEQHWRLVVNAVEGHARLAATAALVLAAVVAAGVVLARRRRAPAPPPWAAAPAHGTTAHEELHATSGPLDTAALPSRRPCVDAWGEQTTGEKTATSD